MISAHTTRDPRWRSTLRILADKTARPGRDGEEFVRLDRCGVTEGAYTFVWVGVGKREQVDFNFRGRHSLCRESTFKIQVLDYISIALELWISIALP